MVDELPTITKHSILAENDFQSHIKDSKYLICSVANDLSNRQVVYGITIMLFYIIHLFIN